MSNGTSLSTAQSTNLAHRLGIDNGQLEFISKKYCNGAPAIEVEHFIRFAHAQGLDISARQAYLIPRKNHKSGEITYTIQIAIDGYRAIAEATNEYDGVDPAVFTYESNGNLLSATVTVYRKGMSRGVSATAFLAEYRDPNSPMWSKMPHGQLAKCAESLALRKAFPKRLGGTYTPDEMDQANVERQAIRNVSSQQSQSVAIQNPDDAERSALVKQIYGMIFVDPAIKGQDVHSLRLGEVAKKIGVTPAPERWGDFTLTQLRQFTTAPEAQVAEYCEYCSSANGEHREDCPEHPESADNLAEQYAEGNA